MIEFLFKSRLDELRGSVANRQTAIQTATAQLTSLSQQVSAHKARLQTVLQQHFNQQLADNAEQSRQQVQNLLLPDRAGWHADDWSRWVPDTYRAASLLCVGNGIDRRLAGVECAIPMYVPFIGGQKAVVFRTNSANNPLAYSLMHSLALRINAHLLHHVTFTFIDPSGFGKAFSLANAFNTRTDSGDLFRLLEDIGRDITRINQTYGLSDDQPFHSFKDSILVNEKFEVIFVANFPKDYDRRVMERLLKIAEQGPVAGKYVFIHQNTAEPLPKDISFDSLNNASFVDVGPDTVVTYTNQRQKVELRMEFDEKPADALIQRVIQTIRDNKPPDTSIDWPAIAPTTWWQESSVEFIEASVGVTGNNTPLSIWFGRKQSEGNRQCVHGVLAGMPGSGKSNFYHALILGLTTRYSPKELALYLVDGKFGVEFQDYATLPHAEFVSLNSPSTLSRSILNDLVEEIERRNELFKETYSVQDYESYRQKIGPEQFMPRLLLIVDEYQELFDGDTLGEASQSLRRISEQGRSAGIHMLLGSQRFGTVGMMQQAAIFGNIHLRIGMKMSLADRNGLTEFGKEGKLLIANCDLPGKIVVNAHSGDDGANKFGKVALIRKANRSQVLVDLVQKASTDRIPVELLTTNIFNGVEQPNPSDNPQLGFLLLHPGWVSGPELEAFARRAVYRGGLGEQGWFSGENPLVFWLGQEFNVRGHARIITRRRQRENVLIVGDINNARYGMLVAVLASAALNAPAGKARFYVIDKSVAGSPWHGTLSRFVEQALRPVGYGCTLTTDSRQVAPILSELTAEIDRRKAIPEDDRLRLNPIFLLLTEADRIDALALQPNKYGTVEETEVGQALRRVYVDGPALGVHSFLSFEGVMPMSNVISRKNADYFRHRVALQMSEQDAFDYVKRREAARLQQHGNQPIAAYYLDISGNKASTFKPYLAEKGFSNELIGLLTAKTNVHG